MTSTDRLKTALANRYKIEREIGSGGMATVYLAEDLKHHRQVAVKVLRPDLAATLGPERFIREIETAARLEHPHILTLIDSGEADGFLFFVMPFVRGESLREKLNHGELPISEAVRILRDVADALAYAHGEGLIHRDVKPDNVLLSGHHAVITDFGVAKAVSEATGRQHITTAGVALGTPTYMAPEQASADPNVDHRADIYALGLLAYEMLTGSPPFTGPTQQAVLAAHITQAPAPVTDMREAIPAALAELVMKCLEKKPADRWQRAEDILTRLDVAATPSMGVTPTDTRPIQAMPAGRTRRNAAILGGAVVVAAVAVGVILLPDGGSPLVQDRVVVGLFENETGDAALDPIGKMAADWITQGLQRTGSVDVIASPTALQASNYVRAELEAGRVADPVEALARETRAGMVVSGTYYRDGNNIRLQVQITDAARGKLIGTLDPVIRHQDSVTSGIEAVRERVMGLLAVTLDERIAGGAVATARPPTFEAYRAFNDGLERYLANSSDSSAAAAFHLAFERDTSFLVPLIYAALVERNAGRYDEMDATTRILEARRAELSDYHQAWVDYNRARVDGDNEAAYRHIRRAAQLAPGSKSVYNTAFIAVETNRPRAALERLAQLDPERAPMRGWRDYWQVFTGANHLVGEFSAELEAARRGKIQYLDAPVFLYSELVALAALGQLDTLLALMPEAAASTSPAEWAERLNGVVNEVAAHQPDRAGPMVDSAVAWFERRPERERSEQWYRNQYQLALARAGRLEESKAILQDLAREYPDQWSLRANLGVLTAHMGGRAAAEDLSDWLAQLDLPHLRGAHTAWRARIAAYLDQPEVAVQLLRQSIREGQSYLWMHRDPAFVEGLANYTPFQELLRPKG